MPLSKKWNRIHFLYENQTGSRRERYEKAEAIYFQKFGKPCYSSYRMFQAARNIYLDDLTPHRTTASKSP